MADIQMSADEALTHAMESFDVPHDQRTRCRNRLLLVLQSYAPENDTDADQIWRDEVVAEYTRLTLDPASESSDRHDQLNEAIRDSIDILYMRTNYGDTLGIPHGDEEA